MNKTKAGRLLAGIAAAPLLLQVIPGAPVTAQTRDLGGTYEQLHPKQQALIGRWVDEYKAIYKRQLTAEYIYNRLPLSARTTFQAVTHALMNSRLTSKDGKAMGTALDLVDVVERVSGQVPEARGDRQFRVYVFLKPGAVNKLYQAKEFERGHDNTVYHIGYPMNFRQQGGVPSIQISVARTGRRADVDVDYRSSSPVKALVSGHLTSANSDVRAGNNESVHNRRWNGLANWWQSIMAAFIEKAPQREPEEGLTPGAEMERRRVAKGPIHEAVHAYLTDWLIKQEPEQLLPLFSVKAYPCVAEFGGDSRPDSKMALLRILRRLQDRNRSLGKVARLEDVVTPVSYRLPDALPVSHAYERVFSLQEVHEDTAWTTDCRLRYRLQMTESVPRPPHRLHSTYVASMRIKNPAEPQVFLVQTWAQEGGEWRIVSFDLKRKTMTPPADLLTAAGPGVGANPGAAEVSGEAEKLLGLWLMKKQSEEAAKFFLPESYACDVFAEAGSAAGEGGQGSVKRVLEFLNEVAGHALPDTNLNGVITAAEAGHPDLRPLAHSRAGAFLLAETSGELLRTGGCGLDLRAARRAAAKGGAEGKGIATIFRLVRGAGEESGGITLNWKKSAQGWRITSYSVDVD